VTVTGISGVKYLSGISRMKSHLRGAAPDIVHTHNFLAHAHGAPAAKSLHIPVIHTKHGRAVTSMSWAPALRRSLYNISDTIAVVSKETGEVFRERSGVDPGKIEVVYNGIDTRKFSSGAGREGMTVPGLERITGDMIVFGAVSRLDPVKDHAMMVRAFARVARGDDRCVLLVVGEGPERKSIESLASELGVTDRVIMPGFTGDVPAYLAAMDMYMQPSLEEGLSLTLLEAAASGVPVVVTPVGGNTEVVEDGVTGTFVRSGDWEGLAGVMKDFIEDPARFRQMAGWAREKVERTFSLESMEEAYRRLYRKAAG
jgi:glycosyltransferase involved in cell wall biosynthesis